MPTETRASVSNDADAIFTQLFLTPEGRANPYPLYHQLRRTAPVQRAKLGMWVLSRYDDCWAALRDPRLGKDYAPQVEQRFGADWRRHPSLTAGEHSMLNTTGPEHTRLRKLVTRSFTPRTIENLKPTIERVVNQLIDPLADAGGGNILEAVGFPLPVTIVGERGVLLDTARAATVPATSHMITYAISRERLRALVAGNATAREWMLEDMRRRYPNLR